MNKKRFFFQLILIACLLTQPGNVYAQATTPANGPVYIIQPGDSLSSIASRFGVNLDDLLAINNITDPNSISAGAAIVIPGLEGVTGVLDTQLVEYGDTLKGMSRKYQVSEALLRKINHITSPNELFVGVGLILPQRDNYVPLSERIQVSYGESMLESAVLANSDPWGIQFANGLSGSWEAIPGDVLFTSIAVPDSNKNESHSGLPSAFLDASVSPLPMLQGATIKINVTMQPGAIPGGMMVDKPLHFFALEDGSFIALQGVHAMLDPGVYPLRLEATLPDGTKQSFEQMVVLKSADYPEDPLLLVEPATIDPLVTAPESDQIASLTLHATETRYWTGIFQSPSYFNDCFTSRYGNRRTYIGIGTEDKIFSFHSGLDFCGGEGLPISAPADGVVVFAGPLTVRGNATIIDHGWGIYSGIWHQSEIKVQAGQAVKKGDIIGLVGGTGRVTGAHLHWEVWVNGIQVSPMDWLNNNYP